MESALRPRDIQARIRAGESIEAVARAAGVPPEKLDAFVAPVIAEREHVAGLAQTHPVRRRGETTSHRTLRSAVNEHLASTDIAENPVWDAWKLEDRRWRVQLTYGPEDARVVAAFIYDQTGHFSVASNEAGRALIGDQTPEQAVRPATPPEPEANDELAIVRAIQSPESADDVDDGDEASEGEPTMPVDEATDLDDAYEEGELTEVDGVYDIVPSKTSMDVLYDMLSSFDEDSVKIYAGLITPKDATSTDEALGAATAEPAEATTDAPDEGETTADEPLDDGEAADAASEGAGSAEESARHEAPAEPSQPEPTEPKVVVVEAAQPSLVESDEAENEPTRPLKRSRRKRASVPSWDEIMFGGPTPKGDR